MREKKHHKTGIIYCIYILYSSEQQNRVTVKRGGAEIEYIMKRCG